MNTSQFITVGLFFVVFRIASCWGASSDINGTNITTTVIVPITTSNITTNLTTMQPITAAQITTAQTTMNDSANFTTAATSMIITTTTNITTSPNITTPTTPTTTSKLTTTTIKPSGRKFDGLSFIGGMILAVGLSAIIYLVVSYLRRNNQLPYSNLH